MMNKLLTVFMSVTMSIVLFSCAGMQEFTVETPRRSPDMLPAQIRSLTLMNRSMTPQHLCFADKNLQSYFFPRGKRGIRRNVVVLDSLASDTLLLALSDLLYSSGRYDVVVPAAHNFVRSQNYRLFPKGAEQWDSFQQLEEITGQNVLPPLGWDEVRQICAEFNTDALLVLEAFYINILSMHAPYYSDPVSYDKITARYCAVIHIYEPVTEKIVRKFLSSNGLVWEKVHPDNRPGAFPAMRQCLTETAINAALSFDSYLSPSWQQETRRYFRLVGDNKQVGTWVTQNNWQASYDYWLPFSTGGHNTMRQAKALYNMALASEMLGDITEALRLADESLKRQYHYRTREYITTLKRQQSLQQQLLR
ncbi:MAG: DUF6340 family protein [Bacteroidales bacterium]|jgi:hypothetical protein|nr:DUF6340 family protein [Bacteroidales bacterium]